MALMQHVNLKVSGIKTTVWVSGSIKEQVKKSTITSYSIRVDVPPSLKLIFLNEYENILDIYKLNISFNTPYLIYY